MSPSERRMTVAHIREDAEPDAVEVMFLESARFYRLLRTNPNFDAILAQLHHALPQHQPLQITLTRAEGDIIADAKT